MFSLKTAIQILKQVYASRGKQYPNPVDIRMPEILKILDRKDLCDTSSKLCPKSKMTPMMNKHAVISNAVYMSDERRQEIARKLGYEIDGDFATSRILLLRDAKHRQTVIAFRGTKLSDISDIRLDIALLLNKHIESDRFKEANHYVTAAIARYGRRGLSVCGHSIGGTIAIYVAGKHNLAAHVFNPGYNPLSDLMAQTKQQLSDKAHPSGCRESQSRPIVKAKKRRNKVHVYIVQGDVISNLILSKGDQNQKVYVFEKSKMHDAHYLGNFMVTDA